MDLKLYRPTVPNFQPQQPSQQNPQQRVLSNTTTLPMSSTFLNFPYENSNEFSWTSSVNGNINNMMNLNNGPQFPRHMASPPPPPLMNPPFPHNGFAAPPPPPQHFSSGGPVGGFQQPPFANGLISPLHSPGLGPVIPHMHNSNGNNFAPPPPSYHNIPPPSASLGSRNHNQHQIPPPPNFAMSSFNNSMTGVMHNSSRENGLGHHLGPFPTPPVSAPSSPSPPPPHMINGYSPTPPPPHGMQPLSPLMMSPNHVHNSHMYRSVPTQLPPLSFQSSIPRTVGTRTANKPLTPPLAKSTLATSTVISRNEPAPVSTNNDQSTSSTLKPKFNPNAASFQPVVKSPAIVSSTPPPKRAVTPPTKTRPHPFNPLSSQFTPSTCSTPSRDEQAERRASGKFNPDAPAFVPVSETPPLPARSSPPPNAPTGPASLVPRTNPPPGSASSIPPYPKLPLSPPTGPKADRNKMPPRPIFGLGIGMGAANEIQERGLPPTTPSGPKAMTTPTGPRADRERPLSRNLSSREGYHPRSYSGSDSYNPREKYAKEPPLLPTVALTRIPGIDKPVPTGPAAMLADLPPAAKIPDVPIAPAAMLAKMESGSQNGSDDGSRGRPGYLMRSSSHTYTRSVIRRWSGRVSQSRNSWVRENDDSRNASKSRDGSDTPVSVAMEIEVTFQELPKTEDIPPLTEEPESYEDEATPAVEALEKTLEEDVEVSATMEKESIKEDEEELVMLVEEVTIVEEPKAPLVVEIPLDESVLPEVKPIAHVEKAASEMEVGTTVVTPALLEQPVFTTDLALEVPVVPASDKVEGPSAPPMEIAVTPVIVSLPSIQIEADDSSRKEVDLDKDLDANLDSFPEFSPAARAATPPLRLSEISMKKREEEGDEIGKNKDVIVAVKEEVAPVEEPEKDKASVEVKPVTAPIRDGSEILTARRATKKSKKKAKKEKKNQTVMAIEPEVASVNPIPVSIAPVEVASEDDIEAPIIKKPSNRGAVVIGGFVHQDGAGTRPVAAVEKNSEQEVGFIAESPLPVEQSVSEVEEVDAMALDAKDEEKPILEKLSPAHKQESEKEVAKATLEENDNEKEHDGGVKLDTIDTLPPLPEDLDEQLVKLTEIYSDSESVKDEQDDEDAAAPVEEEEEEEDEEEPIVEVRPLQVIKAAAPILPSEEELFGAEPEKLGEDVVVIEEESPIAPAQEPVAVVEEPIVNAETEESLVAELLEELLVPAVEAPIVEEVVKEAAFFEPRHTGEIAVSVNSIIGALAACKDINSLSGTLASFSRVSKPGTQEERLFRELHHYAAIADPVGRENSDNRSTRSKSSMRSVRSFFKRRAEAYPQLLSSTTIRIKAILPPFLSMTAAPAINTIPTSGTITPTEQKSSMVSSSAVKSQRSRLLPKMTMSLLSRSFSTKSQKNVVA